MPDSGLLMFVFLSVGIEEFRTAQRNRRYRWVIVRY